MKRYCAALLLLFSLAAFCQTKIAILRQSTGDVSVRHGQQWNAVSQAPVDLFDGDKVATNRGRAEIFYPSDNSTLTVDVGSNVTIHQTQATAGGWLRRVQVYVGDVFFHISKTAETNNHWQLSTPTAVGGVQGTEGQIHVEDEQNSDFTLSEGALEVHHLSANGVPLRNEQPVRIGAGESVQARAGAALLRAKAVRVPRAPRVNVKPEELPQPKPGHMMRTRPNERPPRPMGSGPRGGRPFNNNANLARPKESSAAKPAEEPKQPAAEKKDEKNDDKKDDKAEKKEGDKKEEKPKKPVRKVAPRRRA